MTDRHAPRTSLSLFFVGSFLVLAAAGCVRGHTTIDGGTDGGGDGGPPVNLNCGNGVLDDGEQCDDGNTRYGDGCNQDCQREPGWACSSPGVPCSVAPECGDGFIEEGEECDDGNTSGGLILPDGGVHFADGGVATVGALEPDGGVDTGDGCTSDCRVEPGWTCPSEDAPCIALKCGDGVVAGNEQCDDGNTAPNDGCDANCHLESGWACSALGGGCHHTTCGDTITEGTEECDDGNKNMGDGCNPFCQKEPNCNTSGICVPVCGDGVILPPGTGSSTEECDDGNTKNGDGCSSTCQVERDWSCTNSTAGPPSVVNLPIVYHDLCGDHDDSAKCGTGYSHPDFQAYSGSGPTTGLVQSTLDAEGKVAFASIFGNKEQGRQELTLGSVPTASNPADFWFRKWYRDDPMNVTIIDHLSLPRRSDGSYQFSSLGFFPLDNRTDGQPTLVTLGHEPQRSDGATTPQFHNYSFTSEVRYWFQYKGTEVLSFYGDDDVWVFINDRIALDLGGLHPQASGTVTLANKAAGLGLTVGGIYQAVVWQAERHTGGSNYQLTLNNFEESTSVCKYLCGDGVLQADQGEECDDGNNVSNDGCSARCLSEVN